jgi:hypothetical protein
MSTISQKHCDEDTMDQDDEMSTINQTFATRRKWSNENPHFISRTAHSFAEHNHLTENDFKENERSGQYFLSCGLRKILLGDINKKLGIVDKTVGNVTNESLYKYKTTKIGCRCLSREYNRTKSCKHMLFVKNKNK